MKTIPVAMAVIKQGTVYHLQLRNHKTSSGVTNLIGWYGGMIEGDEEPVQTICREIAEETSLNPNPKDFSFVGKVDVTSEYHGDPVAMNGFLFQIEVPKDIKVSSKEGELVSLSVERAAAKIDEMTPGTKFSFKKYILKG